MENFFSASSLCRATPQSLDIQLRLRFSGYIPANCLKILTIQPENFGSSARIFCLYIQNFSGYIATKFRLHSLWLQSQQVLAIQPEFSGHIAIIVWLYSQKNLAIQPMSKQPVFPGYIAKEFWLYSHMAIQPGYLGYIAIDSWLYSQKFLAIQPGI